MTEIVTIIKKYGVTGLLVVWVYTLQEEVKEMRAMLVDCYEVQLRADNATGAIYIPEKLIAIAPDEEDYSRYTQA
jgi:hypothetical protein